MTVNNLNDTLIIGYGNADREDDGVAWHILSGLAHRLGLPFPASPDDEQPPVGRPLALLFILQLTPELAETIAGYNRVCFVDAHTGAVEEELHWEKLEGAFQASPFTHHMTPSTLLALSGSLYQRQPEAVLVSVRGYLFGFSRELSPGTAELSLHAIDKILNWIRLYRKGEEDDQ